MAQVLAERRQGKATGRHGRKDPHAGECAQKPIHPILRCADGLLDLLGRPRTLLENVGYAELSGHADRLGGPFSGDEIGQNSGPWLAITSSSCGWLRHHHSPSRHGESVYAGERSRRATAASGCEPAVCSTALFGDGFTKIAGRA